MKKIPNILSCSRIIIAIVLPFCICMPLLCLLFYAAAAFTDILDGLLARRLDAQTEAGAKLDSIADFVFLAAVMIILFVLIDAKDIFFILSLGIVTAVRLFNVIFTRIKFRRFGILHTLSNKFTGFLIFASVPVIVWMQKVFYPIMIPVLVCAFISAFEESIILIACKEYKPDRKSLFSNQII